VAAVREKHPAARLVAILELHTFSSLNPAFLPQYAGTLAEADEAIVFFSPHTLAMKKLPDLSAEQLRAHFASPGLTVVMDSESLRSKIASIPKGGEMVMVWMSSGRFDGLDIADVSKSFAGNMTASS
jgi:UDP-N-acetylmuramate: L-alanyl-gamma-D-glutamyl-meso-diaminopimelate ligase